MTDIGERDVPRRWVARLWVTWARAVLAVSFAFGMLGSTARPPSKAETEQTTAVETAEDGEVVAREDDLVRLVRRRAPHGGAWGDGRLAHARPPQRLDPTVPAPIPPCWQRPRRSLPIDDDGIFIG